MRGEWCISCYESLRREQAEACSPGWLVIKLKLVKALKLFKETSVKGLSQDVLHCGPLRNQIILQN